MRLQFLPTVGEAAVLVATPGEERPLILARLARMAGARTLQGRAMAECNEAITDPRGWGMAWADAQSRFCRAVHTARRDYWEELAEEALEGIQSLQGDYALLTAEDILQLPEVVYIGLVARYVPSEVAVLVTEHHPVFLSRYWLGGNALPMEAVA